MDTLPLDIVVYIALTLDLDEVMSLCNTTKRFNRFICHNRNFWIERLKRDYGINYLEIDSGNSRETSEENPRGREVSTAHEVKSYYQFLVNSRTNDVTRLIGMAFDQKYENMVRYLLTLGSHNYVLSRYAGELGNMDIINIILEKGGGDINNVVYGAIKSKHLNLANELIERGADDWSLFLTAAIIINNKELVNRFIDRADHFTVALSNAIKYTDDKELINRLIHLRGPHANFSPALYAAVEYSSDRQLIFELMNLVSVGRNAANSLLACAISSKYNKDLIDEFIRRGANDWDNAMIAVIISNGSKYNDNNRDLIDEFIRRGANQWGTFLEYLLMSEERSEFSDRLIDEFIKYGLEGVNGYFLTHDDINNLMVEALDSRRDDLVERFITMGANGWNSALEIAAISRNVETVKFFVNKGATNISEALYSSQDNIDKRVGNFLSEILNEGEK